MAGTTVDDVIDGMPLVLRSYDDAFRRHGVEGEVNRGSAAEGEMDLVYLVDLERGRKTKLTEGSNPCFVERGKAIVFERWPRERWTSPATAKPDLWRLELTAGARPRKILADASQPAGQ